MYTNNNELLIQYLDNETNELLLTQQVAIADVLLAAMSICHYINIDGESYLFVRSDLVVSCNETMKNYFNVYVEPITEEEQEWT